MPSSRGAGDMSDGSSPKKPRAVEIDAEVRQVKTMADGTVNLTLNLPEYCLPQSQILLGWVREQVMAVIQIEG